MSDLQTYTVKYPSGKTFQASGRLSVGFFGSTVMSPVIDPGERKGKRLPVMLLDPRAIITDASGTIVFTGCSTEKLEDLTRSTR